MMALITIFVHRFLTVVYMSIRKLKNEELDRLTVTGFKQTEKLPVSIILDNVRSMNNVGSAFRTSDAFLVEKLYLGGITATPPHREINKTALGATESVDWEHVPDITLLIQQLQKNGHKVLAVEQVSNSTLLQDFTPIADEKYCFVFGNEVFGVDDKVVNMVDGCIEIPQFGTKHSLNISVSLGVVVWDVFSKIRKLTHQQRPDQGL